MLKVTVHDADYISKANAVWRSIKVLMVLGYWQSRQRKQRACNAIVKPMKKI